MSGKGKTLAQYKIPKFSDDEEDDSSVSDNIVQESEDEEVAPPVVAKGEEEEEEPRRRKISLKRYTEYCNRLRRFVQEMNQAADDDAVLRQFVDEIPPPRLPPSSSSGNKRKRLIAKTGYRFFCDSKAEEVAGKSFKDRNQYLSEQWKAEVDKSKWYAMVEEEKQRLAENPDYTAPKKKTLGLRAMFNREEFKRLKELPEYRDASEKDIQEQVKKNSKDPDILEAFRNRLLV
jgi:hypothetical protein